MAKKKRPQLSPALRQRYREWLRGQRTGAIEYGRDDGAVRDEPLSADEAEGVERWLRDVEHAEDIEFEESDDYEEEEPAAETDTPLLQTFGLTTGWLTVLAVLVGLGIMITIITAT